MNTPTPSLSITSNPVSPICTGTPVTFTAGSITNGGTSPTYQWKLGGVNIAGATSTTYTTSTLTNGAVISLEMTSNHPCPSSPTATSNSITMAVSASPQIVAGNNGPICAGQTLNLTATTMTGATYSWTGPSFSSSSQNPSISNAGAGASGTYTLTVTAPGCVVQPVTTNVVVNPVPVANATPVGAVNKCIGDTVTINANTGTGLTYQWKLNGNNITGATSSSYGATQGGNYTVTVTNSTNCVTTSAPVAVSFTANPAGNITYSSPIDFCEGSAVFLNSYTAAGLTYQWYLNGAPITGATASSYLATQSGSYTVKLTNTVGCTGMSSPVAVQSHPLPAPVITKNNLVLSTGTFNAYQWYYNTMPIQGAINQSYTANINGPYAVAVTDAFGCRSLSSTVYINSLGVGQTALQSADFKVYPNPADDFVTVENKSAAKMTGISLLNSVGALIYLTEASGQAATFPTSQLANGFYMIRIHTEHGDVIRKLEIFR